MNRFWGAIDVLWVAAAMLLIMAVGLGCETRTKWKFVTGPAVHDTTVVHDTTEAEWPHHHGGKR